MSLERLIITNKLVEKAPTAKKIRKRADTAAPVPLHLFYGETYDEKGNTIDSLKYYFFLAMLANTLRKEGRQVDATVLIADSAVCRNVAPDQERFYMSLGTERADFVKRVNAAYSTDLRVLKMSDYIHSDEFKGRLEQVMHLCKQDKRLMSAIEKTVPPSKVDIERKKGFLYSFDEIATIVGLDIKIGPPREDLYDKIARAVAKKMGAKELMSLFLSPTFPIGKKWDYFFSNEGIEDHGITAYKAASKQLQRNRIIIGKSDIEYIKTLIERSFVSTDPALPNPILDIGIICEMAKRVLEKNDAPITLADDFYGGKITEADLRKLVGENLEEYIFSKF